MRLVLYSKINNKLWYNEKGENIKNIFFVELFFVNIETWLADERYTLKEKVNEWEYYTKTRFAFLDR